MADLPRLIDEKEYCRIRGCALQTARNERFRGVGVPYYKVGVGGRSVRYRLDEVLAMIEKGRIETRDLR